MKRREPRESGQCDMFRSRLDQILDGGHEKVILADKIDWCFLSEKMGEVYTDGPGHPKAGRRMDRNRLAHSQGDAINPVLAAAGYNFRLILKWIRLLLSLIRIWMVENNQTRSVQIAA